MDQQQGRARGRSRARATAGAAQETTRRPGDQDRRRQPPARQPPPHAAVPAGGASGGGRVGRSTVGLAGAAGRAGPPSEAPRPVAAVSSDAPVGEATQMVSKLTLATGDNGSGSVRGGKGPQRGRRGEVEVRTRPPSLNDKTGRDGSQITLIANYFPINSTPSWVIFQYHVDFSPDIEIAKSRRALLNVHKNLLGQFLFDGMQLFAANRLPSAETDLFSRRDSDDANIKIRIKFIKEIPPTDPIVMQILSIQMRKNLRHLNFQLLGRQYYDAKEPIKILQHNLELWPGFVTAVHQHELAPLLCADLSFKVLRLDTVLQQLQEIYNRNPRRFREEAVKQLVGQIVLTSYNNRTYRVDDIDFSRNPKATFKLRDGTTVSFIDYFAKTHNIRIKDALQPLLVSNPKRRDVLRGQEGPIVLIPELSTMTGISEATRNDYNVMKSIGEYTRAAPSSRVACITNFLNRINSNQEIVKEMSEWNLSFSNKLVEFRARILDPETICQGDNKTYTYDKNTADWSRELRSKKLLYALNLTNWIVITSKYEFNLAREFVDHLVRVGRPMGMNLSMPNMIQLGGDRASDFIDALQREQNRSVQLVLFVFPNNRKDRYDAVKKHCCISKPIASQVIVKKTIERKNMLMSVATKVAIQLNCKLGGAPWCTQIPMSNAMVIGYDSYHDSSMRGRSVGAVCCSLDKLFTRYHSRAEFQTSHVELVDGLFTSISAGLKRYYEMNKILPERIFIYRDGVGEGQLANINEFEVPQILECIKKMDSDYRPQVAFIVVTKRLNTRLFMRKTPTSIDNPLPGTVADNTITRPEWYDFFLVSQSVRQGTVSPTHYNIIYNTTNFTPNIMQRLTYKLTHLYYNWPGTLRVPAPCMYAHKLAFLIGQSLHQLPHGDLADTLYFL